MWNRVNWLQQHQTKDSGRIQSKNRHLMIEIASECDLKLNFSAFTKTTDTFNKNKRFHMILEGLSSVCAKLEQATSTNNGILETNVLQKAPVELIRWVKKNSFIFAVCVKSVPLYHFKLAPFHFIILSLPIYHAFAASFNK